MNDYFYVGYGVYVKIPLELQLVYDFFPLEKVTDTNKLLSASSRLIEITSLGSNYVLKCQAEKEVFPILEKKECLSILFKMFPYMYESSGYLTLFHGSSFFKNGKLFVLIGRNYIGKSTIIKYFIEKKGAIFFSDDFVFWNRKASLFEPNAHLPLLFREQVSKGEFRERYLKFDSSFLDREKAIKVMFIYLDEHIGPVGYKEVREEEKRAYLLAALWIKNVANMAVAISLAKTIPMYRLNFNDLNNEIDSVCKMIGSIAGEKDL